MKKPVWSAFAKLARALRLAVFIAAGCSFATTLIPGARGAALIHDYEFNGTLNDSLGGPALVPNGGTTNASSYDFSFNQGLTLSNWLSGSASSGNYTIDLSFTIQGITGYRKLVDFANLTSDVGLYALGGGLDFYNDAGNGAQTIFAGVPVRVDLTRDGVTGVVVGYVNGVQQFNFIDSASHAGFTGPNGIITFMEDDTVTGGNEVSDGSINQIRLYDGALSATDVAALGGPKAVPEPSSLALIAPVLAGGIFLLRRFRSRR